MAKIKFYKKIKFTLIFIFLIFFFFEITLRALTIEYPIFQKHDVDRGFSLLENSKGKWRREGFGKVIINSDGLRDLEHKIKKPDSTLRIAILGDSFAEARSVNVENTFWFKLRDNLELCKNFHKGKKIEVINFGVSEYSTTQQFITLKNNVWKYDPDLVLLAFFSGNDVSDNIKTLSKKKYRPYFIFDNENIEIDKSYLDSKPYKIISSVPGKIFIKMSQYSRTFQLFREAYVQSHFKKNKNQKLTSKKKSLNSNVYSPKNNDWLKAWTVTEKIIKMINDEVLKKKREFILVSLSTPIQVDPSDEKINLYKNLNNINDIFYPERRLSEFTKENSIKYIQIAKKMRSIAIKNKIYFHGFLNTELGAGHWNIKGHDIASKLISKGICELH